MAEIKAKQFAEEKVIEMVLANGITDVGRTKFVPFAMEDFGGVYLKYKDFSGTWHNLRAEAVMAIRIYPASAFDEMIKEEETPALTINDNNNNKGDEDEW